MDYQNYPGDKQQENQDQVKPLEPAQAQSMADDSSQNEFSKEETDVEEAFMGENTEDELNDDGTQHIFNPIEWNAQPISEPDPMECQDRDYQTQQDRAEHTAEASWTQSTTLPTEGGIPPYQPQYRVPPIPPVGYNTPYQPRMVSPGLPTPTFAVPAGAPFLQKHGPRNVLRSKKINQMALLCAAQTGFSYLWQILFINVLAIFGLSLYKYSMDDTTIYMEFPYYWLMAILVPLSTLLPFAIYLGVKKPDLSKMIRVEHKSVFDIIFCIIIGFGVCLFANIPANLVRNILEMSGYQSSSVLPSDFNLLECLLYFLGVAILAPVIEEFVFRGIIIGSLEKYGKGMALTVSAIIFGLAHTDFVSVVFATIAGLAFGWMYLKTRNLWVSIIVHFLNNSLAIVQTYSNYWFSEDDVLLFNALSIWIPILLATFCLILMVIFRRRNFFSLYEIGEKVPVIESYMGVKYWNYSSNAGETISALFRSPGFWILVGLSLFSTAQSFVYY